MLKKISYSLCAIIFLGSIQSCNPDCDALQTSNLTVPPGPYEEGTELAIQADPPSTLEGRKFFISARNQSGTSSTLELNSRFEEALGASVVQIPEETDSDIQFLVEDPDCGNLVPIGLSSQVVGATFFLDNPFFVTPAPPLIIIPSPPVAPPPAVVNAWFSPNNRDYCI